MSCFHIQEDCYIVFHIVSFECTVEPVMSISGTTSITIKQPDQKLRLVCRVFGSPYPVIEWRREDGQELSLENQTSFWYSEDIPPNSGPLIYSISHDKPSKCSIESSLRLFISSESHLGSYLCFARNPHGSSVSTFTIKGKESMIESS
jgi:hypothetical protein